MYTLAKRANKNDKAVGTLPMSDRLIQLFAEGLGIDASGLSDHSSPDSVAQWDSLAATRLIAKLEHEFDIRLSTKEILQMRTIGVTREVLRGKGVRL